MRLTFVYGAALTICACAANRASALNIVLDYTYDTYFSANNATNNTAKATIQAAANRINGVITTQLAAVQETSSATFGSTTATFDFKQNFKNPSTGADVELQTAAMPANEFRIYVGGRNLTGNTLGTGGSGGMGFSGNINGFLSEWQQTATNAAANASTNLGRGGGPTISSQSGAFTHEESGTTATFTINQGPTLGNLWFDTDTDNNSVTDDAATFAANWNVDYQTANSGSKSDLYSVALHEILHSLGFGGSLSFTAKKSGSNWSGSRVISEFGTGTNVVESGTGHIKEGLTSTVVSGGFVTTGLLQEVAMDPTITVGTRKELTRLDLAFLEDIGWSTTLPEPSTAALLFVLAPLMSRRARRRA